MKNQGFLSILVIMIIIVVVVSLFVWFRVSVQPTLSNECNNKINYSVIALASISAFIFALTTTYNAIQAIQQRKIEFAKFSISNKKAAKEILRRLSVYGFNGVRADIFNGMIQSNFTLSQEERLQIYNELVTCGYIQRADNDMLKVTKVGEEYRKNWFW